MISPNQEEETTEKDKTKNDHCIDFGLQHIFNFFI